MSHETTTSSGIEGANPSILKAQAEAERRWPESEAGSPSERFWKQRRGFIEGAWWQAQRPTDDTAIETARRAGQMEALAAIDGYLRLVTQNMEGTADWKRGVWALSGRLQHMTSQARSQIKGESTVTLLDHS